MDLLFHHFNNPKRFDVLKPTTASVSFNALGSNCWIVTSKAS